MKMLDINGNEVVVDVRPTSYPVKEDSRSNFQKEVGQWLQEIFPRSVILEEFPIPGGRLFIDFFLPRECVVVEVQGRQHSEFVGFFHGSRHDKKYAGQKMRDMQKEMWAESNGFKVVSLYEGCTKTTLESLLYE